MTSLQLISIAISIGFATVHCYAQEQPVNPAIQSLSKSANEKLAQTIDELNELRQQISAEKLPLAEELSILEEKLTQLRREYDRVTRLVDEGKLDKANLEVQAKARKDELSYVSNLLDEYAKTFESKVNISEIQVLGATLEPAKQATENNSLSIIERFDRQIAFVNASGSRIANLVGGMRFPGTGVDLEGQVAEGQFAIIGPVALFHATSGTAAGLVVPQTGSDKPLIRPLEGAMQAGLVSLVQTGNGFMPLDPSRGGALKALVQRTNLIHIFEKGGPIMWPLLLASVLALGTVLERILFLMMQRKRRDHQAMEAFLAAAAKGNFDEAICISERTKFFVVRALGYALAHRDISLANALLYSQAQELKKFRRGIPILDTVITLAPLLGLLGTVTGMMGSFSIIGGELSAPGAITGGIAEALIATAFGLGIAITALIPFNILNTRMEEARHEIEAAANQLELLVKPHIEESSPAPAAATTQAPSASIETTSRLQREVEQRRLMIQRQILQLQRQLNDPEPQLAALTRAKD